MNTGVVILFAVLALSTAFGLYRKITDGRVKATVEHEHIACLDIANSIGSRATLLQFSSQFCQPCKTTKGILSELATSHSGVEHIEVNAEDHLDLVKNLGIMRTPTTLILDRTGEIVGRAVGVPKSEEVLVALHNVTAHA